MIKVFVTVGSWKFDELVEHIDVTLAHDKFDLLIQYGNGEYKPKNHKSFRLSPSIEANILDSDVVISHGGTGSVLEVLNMGKPLIAVPNPNVMDNHQFEFVRFLELRGMLSCVDTVTNLTENDLIKELNKNDRQQDLSLLFVDVINSLNSFIKTGDLSN